jgi:hypothetical protein
MRGLRYGLLPIIILITASFCPFRNAGLNAVDHMPSPSNKGPAVATIFAASRPSSSAFAASLTGCDASPAEPMKMPIALCPPAARCCSRSIHRLEAKTPNNAWANGAVSVVPPGKTNILTMVPANGAILSAKARCSCGLNERGASFASSLSLANRSPSAMRLASAVSLRSCSDCVESSAIRSFAFAVPSFAVSESATACFVSASFAAMRSSENRSLMAAVFYGPPCGYSDHKCANG